MVEIYTILGFIFAGYSVVANDSLQTLGTWINSNKIIPWYFLWIFASLILALTMLHGYFSGDLSHGRLSSIPYIEPNFWHLLAPISLIILTRNGIPVSTSFLVLSAFASSLVVQKMLMKSIVGYVVAAIVSYILWSLLSRFIDESKKPEASDTKWRIAQWLSTGFLWTMWLQQDFSNIAVFLPRQVSLNTVLMIILFFVVMLGYVFKSGGGKIQNLVIEKTSTKFVRSATIIDLVYAFLLLYFKIYNNIPMSTTFVFVGLLAGRELALNSYFVTKKGRIKKVFPMIGRDFLRLVIGITVSVALIITIQYFNN